MALPGSSIVGRVEWAIPVLGYLLAMLHSPLGLVALLSIGGTLLTMVSLFDELEGDEEPSTEAASSVGVG